MAREQRARDSGWRFRAGRLAFSQSGPAGAVAARASRSRRFPAGAGGPDARASGLVDHDRPFAREQRAPAPGWQFRAGRLAFSQSGPAGAVAARMARSRCFPVGAGGPAARARGLVHHDRLLAREQRARASGWQFRAGRLAFSQSGPAGAVAARMARSRRFPVGAGGSAARASGLVHHDRLLAREQRARAPGRRGHCMSGALAQIFPAGLAARPPASAGTSITTGRSPARSGRVSLAGCPAPVGSRFRRAGRPARSLHARRDRGVFPPAPMVSGRRALAARVFAPARFSYTSRKGEGTTME
ncbi:hypothetical protein ACVCIC_00105 [Burkholderia glumae]